jgi:hypothetical protein
MIHLRKDPLTGDYGLVRFDNGEFWTHIQNDVKPEPIEEHGTMIVLLGNSPDEATVEPPPAVRMPRKWILRYINSRFFKFPAGVTISVREGWDLSRGDRHNFLRKATGQGPWLEENSVHSGTVHLPKKGADVHWWIIKPEVDTNSGHHTPGGHVAAVFQDELYELVFGPAKSFACPQSAVAAAAAKLFAFGPTNLPAAFCISVNARLFCFT